MATKKPKKIRALVGLDKLAEATIKDLLAGSVKGLTEHATVFPKPPIALANYQAAIDAYEASIPAALDGSKTAVAHKNKLLHAAMRMYVELAHYVEANCNDDPATFLLSGFQPASSTKTPPQPLDQPTVTVEPGAVPGQMKIKIWSFRKALSYQLHYAPVPCGGGPTAAWTHELLTSTKPTV